MGDMVEHFAILKEARALDKRSNLKCNLDYLNAQEIDYEVHNEGYQLNIKRLTGGVVAFYPSTNNWVFDTVEGKKKVYYGNAKALIEWIRGEVI